MKNVSQVSYSPQHLELENLRLLSSRLVILQEGCLCNTWCNQRFTYFYHGMDGLCVVFLYLLNLFAMTRNFNYSGPNITGSQHTEQLVVVWAPSIVHVIGNFFIFF
jgi:hypothetical protein